MPSYREVYHSTGLLKRIRRVYRRGGAWFTISSAARLVYRTVHNLLLHGYYRLGPPEFFEFGGSRYPYLRHRYNTTWQNERSVEVPIVWDIVARAPQSARILEVGYVLGHYLRHSHEVLDKYEALPGMIAQDVIDFQPKEKYDLIVSISTLEHVGFDEDTKDPGKIIKAFANIFERCLAPGGALVVTLPLGYNPNLDQLLRDERIRFDRKRYLKKISPCTWREADWNEVRESSYDFSVPSATAIVIGHILKP